MSNMGLSNAVSGFFGAQRAAADDDYRARVRKSQVAQLDDEDARLSDINAARQMGADVMAQRQREAEQAPVGLGLAAPTDPAQTQPVAPDAAPGLGMAVRPPAAAKPAGYTPNPDHILQAYDATTNELAKRGRWDDWAKSWAKGAQIRDTLRNQALDQAEGEYRMSGDPSVFAKKAYKYIEDGYSFVKSEKAAGPDGKPIYNVTRKNDETGAEETKAMTADDLMRGVAFARDPQAVRKAEAQYAMEQKKKLLEIQAEQEKEKVRQPGRLEVANVRATAQRDVAQTNADSRDYRTDNAPSARSGTNADGTQKVRKTLVDSEGYMVGVYDDGPRRLMIDGKPVRSGDWSKRVDKIADGLGKSIGGIGKTPQELRTAAEQTLTASAPASDPTPPERGASQIPAGVQADRDAEAGKLIIRSELGGDVDRARAEVQRVEGEIAKTPSADGKAILREHANRLRAGIAASAASAPAIAGLPKGARQIGTSKGKPVFETPDGKRFIQD